jgi:hypothetical protein
MKKYRVFIILAILFVLYRRSRVGKTATPIQNCSNIQCAGMTTGEPLQSCPEGCECENIYDYFTGEPDIPDAPRFCQEIPYQYPQ